MRRIFFGLVALGAGVGALHFTGRWLQVRDSSGCFGDANCQRRVQRGGDTRNDRQLAIGLFVLTGLSVWIAAGREH
jgi:hypothetical protein